MAYLNTKAAALVDFVKTKMWVHVKAI